MRWGAQKLSRVGQVVFSRLGRFSALPVLSLLPFIKDLVHIEAITIYLGPTKPCDLLKKKYCSSGRGWLPVTKSVPSCAILGLLPAAKVNSY